MNDNNWTGSDVSLEHCLWVVENDTVWVNISNRWHRAGFDATQESTDEWIDICGENSLSSFTGLENYKEATRSDLLGRVSDLSSYYNGVEVYCASQGMSCTEFAEYLGEEWDGEVWE